MKSFLAALKHIGLAIAGQTAAAAMVDPTIYKNKSYWTAVGLGAAHAILTLFKTPPLDIPVPDVPKVDENVKS